MTDKGVEIIAENQKNFILLNMDDGISSILSNQIGMGGNNIIVGESGWLGVNYSIYIIQDRDKTNQLFSISYRRHGGREYPRPLRDR